MSQSRQSVSATLDAIASRRPALHTILTAFEPLLSARAELPEQLADMLKKATAPLPQLNTKRLGHGVPVMADAPAEWAAPLLRKAAITLIPIITDNEELAPYKTSLTKAFKAEDTPLAELFSAFIGGNATGIERMAKEQEIPAAVLAFAAGTVIGPVLAAYAKTQLSDADMAVWREGTCPVCGSFPSIAFLERRDPNQSEFLAGGGGKKHLHCSLCSYEWQFRRGACPSCGNEDAGALEYLRDRDTPWERIDLCRKCNTYCPGIDLREVAATPHMDAAALGMLHLDLVASREGLMPLAPSFWNTFEKE
ncbi:formate dehydrogenase accessory protein FdhE [Oleidesulfovibrio sp.]|uniref:formate dehydrogenase accessory protein FdhE n=1 Tax=Oleidesulfovibrio sp. TaxID=2909707 RepID=UPI003A8C29FF